MRAQFLAVLAMFFVFAQPAAAIGPQLGVRVGTGTVGWEDASRTPDGQVFSVGPAARLNLGVMTLEGDLLWNRTRVGEGQLDRIALPLLGKANFTLVPGLARLSVGTGVEPRWLVGAKTAGVDVSPGFSDTTWYLPVVAGLDLDLRVAEASIEFRYEYQLEPDQLDTTARAHQLLVMAGLFF